MIHVAVIFLLLLSLYAIGNYILYSLPEVEAGPTSAPSHTRVQKVSERLSSVYKKQYNGRVWRYRRFVVKGTCMKWIGIKPQNVISVRMFESQDDKKKMLQPKDVALIFLNDKDFRGYKIRIVKECDKESISTFYYDEYGNEKMSSKPHTIQHIIGVVDLQESGISQRV